MEFVWRFITSFWATAADMSVYLLFGFFAAGVLSMFVSQRLVERHLGGRGFWPVLKASALGVPLPLCSCGVIPVAMSLRKHGASRGSTISFLLSTPQTGVDSILVTYSLLGGVFAIVRPVIALATGIIGGVLVDIFGQNSQPQEEGKENDKPEQCHECCCSHKAKMTDKFLAGMKFAFITLPRDIGGAMLLGLAIAGLIAALVPDDFFAKYLGTGIFSKFVMMLIGIPMYVCATASVPVAAALMMKGLTPGAALVFLMTGPATNAASFATIWKILGSRTAIIYLLTVASCALASGIMLDYFYFMPEMNHAAHNHGWMLPVAIRNISAVALLAVIGYAMISKKKRANSGKEQK
jgi:uncharacterized protein